MRHEVPEQSAYDQFRIDLLGLQRFAEVEVLVEECLGLCALGIHFRAESRKPLRIAPDLLECLDSGLLQSVARVFSIRSVTRRSKMRFTVSLNFSLRRAVGCCASTSR